MDIEREPNQHDHGAGSGAAASARGRTALHPAGPVAVAAAAGQAADGHAVAITRIVATPGGVVDLPEGVSLDDVRVVGADLVIHLPDGSEILVVGGAVFVPQLMVGEVQIPADNLAALLTGEEPQPAAGPPQSAGGNFAVPVGTIGDPFHLGDLIPPTELRFGQADTHELHPATVIETENNVPTITITTPDDPAGVTDATATVDEAGLPARGAEPAGSNAATASETTSGTINYSAADQPATVTIDGTAITHVGQTFASDSGTLTITSIGGGAIGFSYTLTDNTIGSPVAGVFHVGVTDGNGDTATATLTVNIVDDVPTAVADSDGVTEDGPLVADGNVLTGSGGSDANTTDGHADVQGADGATVTSAGTFAGTYGTLVLGSDGHYTYTLDNGSQPVQGLSAGETLTDTFSYTITDGDGDSSTATLTITIGGADDGVTINGLDVKGGEVIVHEDDLSNGSSPDAAALTQDGHFSFTAADGLADVSIGGVQVVAGGAFTGQTITTATGTLTITGFTPVTGADGSVIGGDFAYSYTLADNTLAHGAPGMDSVTDSFAVTITDSDGSTGNASLDVTITDDLPTAAADADAVAAGSYGPEAGNVITGAGTTSGAAGADVPGADGAHVTGVAAGTAASASGDVGVAVAGAYGTLTLAADGSYSYARAAGTPGGVHDTFTYTITDGDGDSSTATLTIAIGDSPTSVTVPTDGAGTIVDEAGLPARGGEAPGSHAGDGSATTTGTINYTAPDGPAAVAIDGHAVTAVGQTIATATGTLTITSIDDGAIGYSYTLADNTAGDNSSETLHVTVTDADGDTSSASLVVHIVDDVPTAVADSDGVTEDGPLVADGNVLTGSGGSDANTTDGHADVQGADGATVTSAGTFAGTYGTLVLGSDGHYTYTLDNGSQPVQGLSAGETLTDTFSYTITDGDGDSSTATLTITIGGADDGVTINGLDVKGGEVIVHEDDLSNGSSPDAAALTQDGHFSFTAADGLADVSIGGVQVVAGGAFTGQTITTATGTLTITGFMPVTGADGSIIGGDFAYSYTLADNTLAHGAPGMDSVTDSFAVTITDSDGSTGHASLDITITDDLPTAAADADAVGEGATLTVDAASGVLGNDTAGADGFASGGGVVGVTAGSDTSAAVSGGVDTAIAGAYGTLTLHGDGSYSYASNPNAVPAAGASDTFVYTVQDGDGDTSTTTLTINLADSGIAASGDAVQVDEAALSTGSNPASSAETVTGTVADNVSGGTGPLSYALIGSAIGSHGTLTLASDGTYTYTLTSPVHEAGADNGADTQGNVETFTYQATDANGNTITNTITIDVRDDVPTAHTDTGAVSEGATLTVDAASGVLGNDTAGADGFASSGGVVGVAAGSDTSVAVSGGVDTAIAGTYGTLTLHGDGSYSYASNPNAVPAAGATDTFVYTVQDGDGDTSTTTLTINLADSGIVTGSEQALVDEAALSTGSNPASTAETVTGTVADNVSGGTGPFTYALVTGPSHGTITFNADGSYSYTLTAAIDGTTADDGANVLSDVDSITYRVTDADGNTALGTIHIDVKDDVPTAVADPAQIVVEGGAALSGNVLGNDVQGADHATLTDVTIGGANHAIAASGTTDVTTANGTYSFAADGSWTFQPAGNLTNAGGVDASFSYTITDGDGDTSSAMQPIIVTDGAGPVAGTPITLTVDDQNLATGSTPAGPDSMAATLDFTPGSDHIASIAFSTDLSGLDTSALTWTRVSDTQIVGMEGGTTVVTLDLARSGDSAVVTATLDSNYGAHALSGDDLKALGSIGVVATDTDGDTATGTVNLAVSDDVPTITASAAPVDALTVDESNFAANATADFSGLFNVHYNADGQGGAATFALGINVGATGLVDTATHQAVVLTMAGGQVVATAGVGGPVVFTVSVDAGGMVTLDQMRAVVHGNAADPNDAAGLAADNLITLTETVIDGDGDAASVTANIGGAISFRDDCPAISVDAAGEAGVTLVTHDALTLGAASDIASSAADFSGIFSIVSASYGADGPGTTSWHYALSLTGGASSGLSSGGAAISLYLVGGEVVGSTAASAAGVTGSNTIFSLSVDAATGTVTLTQFAAIDHALPGTDTNYASQLATLADHLVALTGTATITDGDGDHTAASATIDLGGNIQFADDGPAITASGAIPTLTVDESDFAIDASHSFASVFNGDYGGDGAGTTTYQLGINAGPTGLVDTLTHEAVVLSLTAGGVVEGRTAVSNQLVFTVSVDASGIVTLDESRAIVHADPGNPNDAQSLAAGLVTLTATITDHDGDTASATANIGDRLVFLDDGPQALSEGATVTEGGGAATGNVLANDMVGADMPGVVTAIAGGTLGAPIVTAHGVLTLAADGSYSYTPNASVAAGTVDSFTYTMRDADGDTSSATLSFTFAGDANVPIGASVAATVDDDGLPGGIAGGTGDYAGTAPENVATGSLGFAYGGDGPAATGAFAFANGTGTVGTETVNYSWDAATNQLIAVVASGARTGSTLFTVGVDPATGAYTVTLLENVLHAAGGDENNAGPLSLAYSVVDSDGSIANGAINLTFNDDTPTLGTIQDGTASNQPSDPLTIGTLHFATGADGAGDVSISLTTTGLTSGGHAIITQQVGNVLTAYADVDGSGSVNGGDTAVFTLTVDPAAGASGQYSFDLLAPLDGSIVKTQIGGSSAFGSGPTAAQILSTTGGGTNLAVVSGWHATGGFDEASWLAGGDPQSALTAGSVNGSTGGWGVDNNNFTAGEFMRFDFGAPNDFDGGGPYTTPGVTLPQVSYATFSLIGYGGSDKIEFVVHYAEGGTAAYTVTGSALGSPYTITAPAGEHIDWIDLYTPNVGGSGKISLTSVGVQNSVVDHTLTFDVGLKDGDGDAVSGSFSIHVADGLTASSAAPVAVDLNGDGLHFLAADAGVRFDYAGDGHPQGTAWVAPDDGLLARDANGDGRITSGAEIVFATGANGTTSDLAGLRADYDTNHDGRLSAADADFAQFGIWQDANSNGVSDPGEFKTLGQLGITSIDLSSDGKAHEAAGGDVLVQGESTFTWSSGATGTIADAAFRVASNNVAKTAEGWKVAASSDPASFTNALVAASLVAAAGATLHQAAADGGSAAHPASVASEPVSVAPPVALALAGGVTTHPSPDASSPSPEHGGAAPTSGLHTEIASVRPLVEAVEDRHGAPAAPEPQQHEQAVDHAVAAHPAPIGNAITVAAVPAAILAQAAEHHGVGAEGHQAAVAADPGKLAHVLADAIEPHGQANVIDTMLDSLPKQAGGGHAAQSLVASTVHETAGHAATIHAMPLIDHFAAAELSHMAHAAAAAVAHG